MKRCVLLTLAVVLSIAAAASPASALTLTVTQSCATPGGYNIDPLSGSISDGPANQTEFVMVQRASSSSAWNAGEGLRYGFTTTDGSGAASWVADQPQGYGLGDTDTVYVQVRSTLDSAPLAEVALPVCGREKVLDGDGDGVNDDVDNCPAVANATQTDADGDQVGDACDSDRDGDGVANATDNCADAVNPGQQDLDGDQVGDACDSDRDGDGIANGADNCADTANHDQADADNDGMGDVCDADRDSDGVPNASDNCPAVSNADQADADGDTTGDACDSDRDGDGVANVSDNCAVVPNPDQADRDKDGIGNACDTQDSRAGAIGDLIAKVNGLAVQSGTKTSLVAKLRAALSAYNANDDATTCDSLGSFLNEVRAQSGKKLTTVQAAQLSTDATAIRTSLGCS